MAVNLISVEGGNVSNSYISLSAAEVFFSERLNSSSWVDADEEKKKQALIMATSQIESYSFKGRKKSISEVGAVDFQRLKWPRYPGNHDPYDLGMPHLINASASEGWVNFSGVPIVPEKVRFAQCEQALYLLINKESEDKRAAVRAQGIQNFSAGKMRESYSGKIALVEQSYNFLNSLACIDFNTSKSVKIERG